ncbi:MAG: PhzF family phenazine biosynthesis protein [Sedimentibacter sp.]
MKFSIVDVFADRLFGGNPAGVVILPDGTDFPSDEIMVKTAAELRYSETAFIKKLGNEKFNVRYFTPAAEVDLCGHATIGSFYTLLCEGIIKPGKTYVNQTLAGELAIVVNDSSILMDMADPEMFETISSGELIKELYNIMGLDSKEQGICDEYTDIELLPKKVSTGLMDIMIPVRNEDELEKINPDFKALTELSKRYEVVGVHAFTLNSKDGNIHVRNFAPLYDIDEEAATGTSNGALTYYLYNYGIVKLNHTNNIIQGEKMGRPSKISTQIVLEDGNEKVKVGGFAITLATGEINI